MDRSSLRFSTPSAIACRMRARSAGDVAAQAGNALLAAATACAASSAPPRATCAMTVPSIGLMSSNVSAEETRRPPIQCSVATSTPATLTMAALLGRRRQGIVRTQTYRPRSNPVKTATPRRAPTHHQPLRPRPNRSTVGGSGRRGRTGTRTGQPVRPSAGSEAPEVEQFALDRGLRRTGSERWRLGLGLGVSGGVVLDGYGWGRLHRWVRSVAGPASASCGGGSGGWSGSVGAAAFVGPGGDAGGVVAGDGPVAGVFDPVVAAA